MGWTLERLAERADMDVSFLSGVERGLRNVSLRNLERIAAAFALSLAELCELPTGRERGKTTNGSAHFVSAREAAVEHDSIRTEFYGISRSMADRSRCKESMMSRIATVVLNIH
jgi:transcriptional regulator with XRE-family HTH domain